MGSKRKILTVAEKMNIIRKLESGATNALICKKFNLNPSTVSTIWKNRQNTIVAFDKNKLNTKKLRKCVKNDLDDALLRWVELQKKISVRVNGPTLRFQAEKIAGLLGYSDFICSNGWLNRFKNRNHIVYGKNIMEIEVGNTGPKISAGWIDKEVTPPVDEGLIGDKMIDITIEEMTVKSYLPESEDNISVKSGTAEEFRSGKIEICEEKTSTESFDKISCTEAQSALQTLSLFFETNQIGTEFLVHLNKLQNIVHRFHLTNM